ncbi:MAG: uroporphyrinogen-III C-methyltransferase [Sulfuriferula sp.]
MAETQDKPDLLDKLGDYLNPALIFAVLAFMLAAWQWWQTRIELNTIRHELSQRLTTANEAAQESRILSQQTADNSRDLTLRVAEIQARLADSQNQQLALEALYRDMAKSRDDWTLADIEQIVLSANQQLQLNGNVKAAIIALQNADARLQAINKPQFTNLRRALNADIQRLQALPQVDTVGITLRLDNLITQIDQLPLASDHEIPAKAPKRVTLVPTNQADRFALEMWQELKSLVQIRRLDTPDSALLAPKQSYFLRQNLKLRLLTARIALFAHDEVSYKADLNAAKIWLTRYFNVNDKRTQNSIAQINKLIDSPISIQLPGLEQSLNALQTSRLVRDQ